MITYNVHHVVKGSHEMCFSKFDDHVVILLPFIATLFCLQPKAKDLGIT